MTLGWCAAARVRTHVHADLQRTAQTWLGGVHTRAVGRMWVGCTRSGGCCRLPCALLPAANPGTRPSVCLSVCLSVCWPPLSTLVVEAAAAKLRHSLETKSTTDLAAVLARPEVDAVVITTASGAQLFWPLQPLGSTSLLRSLYWLPGFFAGSSECTHCSRLWDWQSWTS